MRFDYDSKRGLITGRRMAATIAIAYAAIGVLWITLSDRLAWALAPDTEVYRWFQLYKGWIFVLLTAIVLYWLLRQFVETLRGWEQAVETVQSQLARTFDTFPHAVAMTDEEGKITYVNRAYCELLAYEPEHLLGESVMSTGLESDLPELGPRGTMEHVRTKEKAWSGDALRVDRNGRVIPVYLTVSPLIGRRDDLIGYLGVLLDRRSVRDTPPYIGAFAETLERVSTRTRLEQLGPVALAEAVALVGGDCGIIALLDEDTDEGPLRCRWRVGLPEEGQQIEELDAREGLWGAVLDRGTGMIVENAEEVPASLPIFPASDVQSAIGVPVELDGKVSGVLLAASRQRAYALGDKHLHQLEALARQVAAALRREKELGALTADRGAS